MTFVDAIHDRNNDTIKIVERINGKRFYNEIKAEYVLYYEDPHGQDLTMWNVPCSKVSTNKFKDFQNELVRYSDRKIHESDINPIFRCLEKNYLGKDTPKLNLAIFDIETDFDPSKGYASPWDTFSRITAISVHLSHLDRLVTFVLKPDVEENDPNYLTQQQAEIITGKFENCYLCENENKLLNSFLEYIEDSDVLTGWNCLEEDSPIFLSDRIIKIKDVRRNDKLVGDDEVLEIHNSGLKSKLRLTLVNGMVINSSEEHRFPVLSKAKDKFTNFPSLKRSVKDLTLKDIISIREKNDVYMKVDLKGNSNQSLTWGDYIRDNFDILKGYDWFDLVIDDQTLRDKIWNYYKEKGCLIENGFTWIEYRKGNCPNLWSFNRHNGILDNNDIQKLLTLPTLRFNGKYCRAVTIQMNEVITSKYWRLLGFIFTDGHYSKCNKEFSFCNKREEVINHYSQLIEANPYLKWQDNCYYSRKNNALVKLLSPFIYSTSWKKVINIELLSRCSITQFADFFAAAVDGDGSVLGSNIGLCEYHGNSKAFQTLFSWFGIYTNRRTHNIAVPFIEHNEEFLTHLELAHSEKRYKLAKRRTFIPVNSSNKLLDKFYDKIDLSFYVKIKNIELTNEIVPMYDIMTGTEYFMCNGVKVHNSAGFDMPYLVNRITRILGKDATKKLCLWDKEPKKRDYIKYKKKQSTYDLIGRVHLDYLDLYTKHNMTQLHSYRLDFVGEIELGETKIPYEGTLDTLYKKDFEKFIAYNRQDTMLLFKIDKKRKFIELANQLAHTNSVLLPTTMGSVALIEQAIVNATHTRGMVVSNKKHTHHGSQDDVFAEDNEDSENESKGPAVGAYVADPKIGLHKQIGCCDIKSLYPSTLRALNMGPETLVAQIRCTYTDALISARIASGTMATDAWLDIFCVKEFDMVHQKSSEILKLEFPNGDTSDLSGAELYDFIFAQDSEFCLSANGTIFRTDVEAIIPGLLKTWYFERQEMQDKAANYKKLAKIESDLIRKKEYLDLEEFWDQRQLARKILLNALYGSLLNEHMRFYDHRIGQSVTLTGRSIAKHMGSKISEILTGDYNHLNECLIYQDTDSGYFSIEPIIRNDIEMKHLLDDRNMIIQLYDSVSDQTNDSFPEFMNRMFNTGIERGSIIRASRELVGSQGLFITKKRYAILMYDKEGTRLDIDGSPGKIKAMGLDLKRSDTPKMMQDFLESILLKLLMGESKENIINDIKLFRIKFRNLADWLKGTPKRVNSLSMYFNKTKDDGNLSLKKLVGKSSQKGSNMVPGHVQASLNWNKLQKVYDDRYSMEIQDGQKVIVCKLKSNNTFSMSSIAYPIDEMRLPEWFMNLPFDAEAMEAAIIDSKIENLLSCLKWDLTKSREDTTFNDLFSFGS